MDFLDTTAVESEDEGETIVRRMRKANRLLENDDDDDDDEERIVIDLRESTDEQSIDKDSRKDSPTKRRKYDDIQDQLNLEDEETRGKILNGERRRFRRIRMLEDDGESVKKVKRKISANGIFHSSVDEADQLLQENCELDYPDDEDNFIVDDDNQSSSSAGETNRRSINKEAYQTARSIFGFDCNFDDSDEYDGSEGYHGDESEEDTGQCRRNQPKKTRKKSACKSIFEIYEPEELKRGYFTNIDSQIRKTDIPERMQLRGTPVTHVPDGSNELDEEAEWIYQQVFCKPSISTQDLEGVVDPLTVTGEVTETEKRIKNVLDLIRNQQFEVPFIAFYRKEYILPELNLNNLWKIYQYDGKWCELKSRKEAVLKLFQNIRQFQLEKYTQDLNAPLPEDARVLSEEEISSVKDVQTLEELNDLRLYFLLHYGHLIPEMCEKQANRTEKQLRRNGANVLHENEPKQRNREKVMKPATCSGLYILCRKAKLDDFAKCFGLSPAQLAENLRDNFQRHDIEQEEIQLAEVAHQYVGSVFKTSEDVLKAVKYMIATQISREPLIRKVLRGKIFQQAKLNVIPTKKGIDEIDEYHPCFSMKYLKGKPVRKLIATDYLKLHIAEEEKLLKITFDSDLEGLSNETYLGEMKSLYIKDDRSSIIQEWNDVKSDIIDLAYEKMLWPDIVKELKAQLLSEAQEHVLKLCSQKLYNWLKVAPCSIFFEEDHDDWDTSEGIRVMAVAYVEDLSQAAFACLVTPKARCADYLRLPNLLLRKDSFRKDKKTKKEDDLKSLRNFISAKKPHIICVGAESRDAFRIVEEIKEQVNLLEQDEQFPMIPIEIVDNSLAKVYANSIKGQNDFRDYPVLLRESISLARRMQNPLAEFSQLCTNDKEITCLRYHALQDYVPQDDLMETITREFVNRTNEVGVDINEIVENEYMRNLLQFVCGFGPRKANALMKMLQLRNIKLQNREQLVTVCHMGPKILFNCAGFIKFDTDSLSKSDEARVEVLDGSRIHPEAYEWARKMASDALEHNDEITPTAAVERIIRCPDQLMDLDMDALAEELERQGFGNKIITLYDIRAELNHRYKDLRDPYSSLNAEELFNLTTKENPETFYIGKMIVATVTGMLRSKPKPEQIHSANPTFNDDTGSWQCPFCYQRDFSSLPKVWNHLNSGSCPGKAFAARIKLDNGLSGCIFLKNLSDEHTKSAEERVRIGDGIHCRIMKINVELFSIEATIKTSDLKDENGEWRPKDEFYDYEMEENDKKIEENKKITKETKTFTKRDIIHPSFHNISFTRAIALLKEMDQGEYIVRPSNRGIDHLTFTWKVAEGVYQHIDILEENKTRKISIGKILRIANERFEDLDEIIVRFINPMAACAQELLSYKHYKDTKGGKVEIAEELLRTTQRKKSKKVHYMFSVYAHIPGTFLLFYLKPNKSIKYEYVTVTPDGFKFRNQVFVSLKGLVKWFKQKLNEPISRTLQI